MWLIIIKNYCLRFLAEFFIRKKIIILLWLFNEFESCEIEISDDISFDEINELFAEENCCGGEQLLSNLPALTFCDNK